MSIIKVFGDLQTNTPVDAALGDVEHVNDSFKIDPNQLVNTKVSSLSGANKKKFIIGEVFSSEGTAKNRKDGTYTFPGNLGNGSFGADKLRDAMGKYWTYSDDGKEIIFLNPFVNEKPINVGAANLPITVHFAKPTLLNDQIWPEYEQHFVITPDLDWIFENLAKPVFDVAIEQFKPFLEYYMQNNSSPADISAYIEDFFFKGENDYSGLSPGYNKGVIPELYGWIEKWWAEVVQIPNVGNDKGCIFLSQEIYGIDNFGDEICAPWLDLNTPFLDHVFDVGMPIENRLSEQYQPLIGVKFPFYNLNSEYNFYIQNYEKILKQFKDKSVPNPLTEKVLPNIYPFISSFVPQALTGEKSDYNKYKNLISLGGIVKDYTADALKITGDILEDNNLKKPPKSSKRYFSKWSSELGMALLKDASGTFDILEGVGDKYKMVLFPMYHPTILQDYDDQKFMFPMYNELNFSTGTDNIVGDIARQAKLTNDFMRFFIRFAEPEKFDFDALLEASFLTQVSADKRFVEVEHKLSVTQGVNNQPTTSTEKIIDENKFVQLTELEGFLATLNLDDFFQSNGSQISNLNLTANLFEQAKQYNMDSDIDGLVRQNTTFITVDENDDYAGMNAGKEMQKMLLAVVFIGKLRKMAKQKFRSYKDIMSGKINYSETVMYVVNKRIVDPTTEEAGDVMQSYYFLNTSKVDVLRFIDSQVNYDVKYQYDVEAIVLSLGSSYYYYDPQFADLTSVFGNIQPTAESVDIEGVQNIAQQGDDIDNTEQIVVPGQPGGAPLEEVKETGDFNVVTGGIFGGGGSVNNYNTAVTGLFSSTPVDLMSGLVVGANQPTIEDIFDPEASFDDMFSGYKSNFDGKVIDANKLSIRLKVRTKPNYKLARVQIASTRGRVVDKPPVFPDVLITPYKGINNKLLINLNQNVGEYFMKPIFFNANDEEQYQNQLDAQKVSSSENPGELLPIEYKGDDQISKDGYFEVYRLERRPETYKDFQGHLMTELRGYHEMEVGHLDTNSVSLRDDILPNKKYYYTFRAVDVHGHVSNPSPVFEVEMIDDSGTVYMIQKIIELQPPNIKDVSKTAKKYIQIKPAFEHSLMSVDATGDVDASAFDYGDGGSKGPINLGVMPVALWGKKFKIRITSKSSGKQIDLNVTFNKKERTSQSLGSFSDNVVYVPEGISEITKV